VLDAQGQKHELQMTRKFQMKGKKKTVLLGIYAVILILVVFMMLTVWFQTSLADSGTSRLHLVHPYLTCCNLTVTENIH